MKWLKKLVSGDPVQQVTFDNPLIIGSPRIGLLNLMGTAAEPLMRQDRDVLGPLFAAVEESDSNTPVCDVLMIYCSIQSDGVIALWPLSLQETIIATGASIVIVASENDGESYIAAGTSMEKGLANLVMTLKRKDPLFTTFFAKLFRMMFEGQSMLLAWVELAPQMPGIVHEAPETIFAADISHIVFETG